MARVRASGSSVPASSRAECIDSSGMPTSTVAIPSRVAVNGPMVEPQGTALLDTNSCVVTPVARQMRRPKFQRLYLLLQLSFQIRGKAFILDQLAFVWINKLLHEGRGAFLHHFEFGGNAEINH